MIWGTSTCTLTSLIECEIGFCFSDHCFIFFFVCTMLIFLFLSVSSIEDSMFNSRSSGQAVAFDPLQFTNFSKVVYIYSTVILFELYYLCQHWGLIWMYPRTQAITILKIWQKFFFVNMHIWASHVWEVKSHSMGKLLVLHFFCPKLFSARIANVDSKLEIHITSSYLCDIWFPCRLICIME